MGSKYPLTVTLIIPGLCAFTPEERLALRPQLPDLPALSDLLSHSRLNSYAQWGFESVLCARFGMPLPQPPPLAALTYWYDKGFAANKPVLRADPVYLKVDRDCLYLLGREALEVSQAEADTLTNQINQLYSDTSWTLEVGTANRWYITGEQPFNIKTFPIAEAFGKNVAAFMPQGEDAKQWRAVLNEIQMLLHSSEVNIAREMNRRLPINSVWLWGEGQLPASPANPMDEVDCVWSDNALCRGLARWAGCRNEKLPHSASEWIELADTGRHWIVFEDMRMSAREDFSSWISKLTAIDENWLAYMRDAANVHRLQLSIDPAKAAVFEYDKSLWSKLWNKKRSWYDCIQ